MSTHYLEQHCFLVASPKLDDSRFARAVIYLDTYHTRSGASGIMINKPLDIHLDEVLEQLNLEWSHPSIATHPVLMGGPVHQEHGFILHNQSKPHNENRQDIVLSTSKDILTEIGHGEGPKQYLVALGYANWEMGQLEQEIAAGYWIVVPFSPVVMFEMPIESRWRLTAALVGVNITSLSAHVGHA